MVQLVTEMWAWLLGTAVTGGLTGWLVTRMVWSRLMKDHEQGWRRRVRAIEEGWMAKLENARQGFQTEREELEGRVNRLGTDLESERGRVTTLRDDLDERGRALAERSREMEGSKEKLAQLDDRLADALERSDRYELELRATRVEAEGAGRDRNELASKLSQRGTRLQELESVLTHREARIAELEPLVHQVREQADQVALLKKEHSAETARLGEELSRLRIRASELPALEQQLRDRFAELESLRGAVARLEPLRQKLTDAHAENSRHLETITALKGDLAALEAARDSLSQRFGDLKAQAAERQARLAVVEPQAIALSTCREESQALRARVVELSGELAAALLDRSEGQEAERARLQERIAELEKRPLPTPDDLKRIRGVGPTIEKLLHGLGVHTFQQIGAWDAGDIVRVNEQLGEFHGRIEREGWITQARDLHVQKYGETRQG